MGGVNVFGDVVTNYLRNCYTLMIERGDIGIRVGANFVIKTIMTTIPPLRSGEGRGEGAIYPPTLGEGRIS